LQQSAATSVHPDSGRAQLALSEKQGGNSRVNYVRRALKT